MDRNIFGVHPPAAPRVPVASIMAFSDPKICSVPRALARALTRPRRAGRHTTLGRCAVLPGWWWWRVCVGWGGGSSEAGGAPVKRGSPPRVRSPGSFWWAVVAAAATARVRAPHRHAGSARGHPPAAARERRRRCGGRDAGAGRRERTTELWRTTKQWRERGGGPHRNFCRWPSPWHACALRRGGGDARSHVLRRVLGAVVRVSHAR